MLTGGDELIRGLRQPGPRAPGLSEGCQLVLRKTEGQRPGHPLSVAGDDPWSPVRGETGGISSGQGGRAGW